MPEFREAGPEAKQRLVNLSKASQQRQMYRDKLGDLVEGKLLEIQPRADESLRKIKVNVSRAASEMNLNVRYGETVDGTLLVWTEPVRERRTRAGRPRRTAEAATTGA